MKFCSKCNKKYEDRFQFCKKCGSQLVLFIEPVSDKKRKTNLKYTYKNKSCNGDDDSNVSCFAKFFLIVMMLFSVYSYFSLSANNFGSSKVSASIQHNVIQPINIENKDVKQIEKKSVIPSDFMAINILGRNIYVPRNIKRITNEEITYDTSSYQGFEHLKAGVALYGVVDNNRSGENKKEKRYEVIVTYSKSPNFRNMTSEIEEKSFDKSLSGTLISAKKTGNIDFLSKDICKNFDGHSYLRSEYIITGNGNFNYPIYVRYIVIFYDDTMYNIFLKTPYEPSTLSSLLNDKTSPNHGYPYDSDIYYAFDIIAKTFGTYQTL